LNYRPSLWKKNGGQARAQKINRELMGLVDCLFGNEEDFVAALGFKLQGGDATFRHLDSAAYRAMILEVVAAYPNLTTVGTSLRLAPSATRNGWGGILYHQGAFYEVPPEEIEILDRVGGGDSFAAGVIYGLLSERGAQFALECGVAHGALAMSTPGDTSMASLAEVQKRMSGQRGRIER
jgi:2-dehydro-3-deoxygluconokinase